ncbi:MAG: hypothetical protein WDO17_22100 [Alphaproteobacteria bacterium]
MSLMWRALFVIGAIVAGRTAIGLYWEGPSAFFQTETARVGNWREAKLRPACQIVREQPAREVGAPARPQRVSWEDHERALELSAALNCFLVTQTNAVCERDNRAYVIHYVGEYFSKMEEMLASAARHGDDDVRAVRSLWNAPNNRAALAALDENIRFGKLHTSDFGRSAPAPLKPQLAQWAKMTDGCAGLRPWAPVKVTVNW